MKLLFDQNLSRKLPGQLGDIYPESQHVAEVSFAEADDADIWQYARERGLTIVSKDADFSTTQPALRQPTKIYLAPGWELLNSGYRVVASALQSHHSHVPRGFTRIPPYFGLISCCMF